MTKYRRSTLCVLVGAMVLLTGCVGIGGETIRLSHDNLGTPKSQFSETLLVKSPAEDLRPDRRRIGRATITIFAITSGSIRTQESVEEEILNEVKLALEASGYRVKLLSGKTPTEGHPTIIKAAVHRLYFKNYNWLFPFVPTWGDIEISLTVEDASGERLFQRSFNGSGTSYQLIGQDAFETATKEAMTEICRQIRDVVASTEFRRFVEAQSNKSGG